MDDLFTSPRYAALQIVVIGTGGLSVYDPMLGNPTDQMVAGLERLLPKARALEMLVLDQTRNL